MTGDLADEEKNRCMPVMPFSEALNGIFVCKEH
ncbi:hypothetical protein HDC89_000879 [Herbaspirillum sp. SJZ102]|nr:hypothetical protein [Herbaspirillum sp. SJZ102]